jgi:hypothetical protein
MVPQQTVQLVPINVPPAQDLRPDVNHVTMLLKELLPPLVLVNLDSLILEILIVMHVTTNVLPVLQIPVLVLHALMLTESIILIVTVNLVGMNLVLLHVLNVTQNVPPVPEEQPVVLLVTALPPEIHLLHVLVNLDFMKMVQPIALLVLINVLHVYQY